MIQEEIKNKMQYLQDMEKIFMASGLNAAEETTCWDNGLDLFAVGRGFGATMNESDVPS